MAYWDNVINELQGVMDRLNHTTGKMASSKVAPLERRKLRDAWVLVKEARDALIIDRHDEEKARERADGDRR